MLLSFVRLLLSTGRGFILVYGVVSVVLPLSFDTSLYAIFTVFIVLFLVKSENLILSLIILEILGFIVLLATAYGIPSVLSDHLQIALFSVLVMGGVIALAGLVLLVTGRGSDYMGSKSLATL